MCSFVLGQSRAKVSAGFTDVSGLAVTAFDPVAASPSLSSGFSLSLTLVSSRRKLVIGFLYNTKIESAFDVFVVAVVKGPE